jgi:hypothetical protein
MSLRGKLEAKARGDIPTAELLAYGGSNSDAYDLLDNVPPQGVARLAAWCAFVLQTYGDKLLQSGRTEGYASEPACAQAQVLYQFSRDWLERARQAAADPGYQLDVAVPQALPRPLNVPPETDQVAAMKRTLEAVQARAGVELAACGDPTRAARLQPSLAAVASALDAAIVSGSGGPDVRASAGRVLVDGLDHAYSLGQLLAMPGLLAAPDAAPRPAVKAATATLGVFLPGDAGFDPWCLTDPLERPQHEKSNAAAGKLDYLWKSDPEPALTLALQADIAAALEHGAVDYLPSGSAAWLERITSSCPWPGAMYAKEPVLIGGIQLAAGDRFVLAVGGWGATFRRAIVRLPAGATVGFSDASRPPHLDDEFPAVLELLQEIGLDILIPPW